MSLAKRANGALLTKLGAAALTYGFTLVLARWMSPGEFGQVAFFMNAAFLVAVLGAAGQHLALLRFLPGALHSGNGAQFHATLSAARCRAAVTTCGALVCFLIIAFGLRTFGALDGFSPLALATGALLIPAIGLIDFQAHLARSLNKIQLSLWPKEILWRCLTLAILATSAALAGTGASTAPVVLVALAGSLGLLAIINHVKITQAMPAKPAEPSPPHAEWAQTARPFWISSIANIFLANADVIAVGVILGASETGGYFLANRLAVLLAFFVVAHNVVIGPVISAKWARHQTDDIAALGRQAAFRMSIPTLALAAILVMLGAPILALFGTGYEEAAQVLWLLAAAGVINALGGPSDIIMNLCGRERQAMRIATFTLVLSASLIITLGLLLGAVGVAMAVTLSMLARKVLFGHALARCLGMRVDIFTHKARPPLAGRMRA